MFAFGLTRLKLILTAASIDVDEIDTTLAYLRRSWLLGASIDVEEVDTTVDGNVIPQSTLLKIACSHHASC